VIGYQSQQPTFDSVDLVTLFQISSAFFWPKGKTVKHSCGLMLPPSFLYVSVLYSSLQPHSLSCQVLFCLRSLGTCWSLCLEVSSPDLCLTSSFLSDHSHTPPFHWDRSWSPYFKLQIHTHSLPPPLTFLLSIYHQRMYQSFYPSIAVNSVCPPTPARM
jgi:hypothetical protein